MYYIYIIKSSSDRYYVGSTEDVEERLAQHNSGTYQGWTRRNSGWRVVYSEEYATRREALIREKSIKAMKGGNAFKALVGAS